MKNATVWLPTLVLTGLFVTLMGLICYARTCPNFTTARIQCPGVNINTGNMGQCSICGQAGFCTVFNGDFDVKPQANSQIVSGTTQPCYAVTKIIDQSSNDEYLWCCEVKSDPEVGAYAYVAGTCPE